MKHPCGLCRGIIDEDKSFYFLATSVHKECLNHPIVRAIELLGEGQSFLNKTLFWDVLKKFNKEILDKYLSRIKK